MWVRALMAALPLLLSAHADAQSLAERRPWHAEVASPRPGLPDVSIDLGYPGPYIPVANSPIAMHAMASRVPFDGYIGYHFAVGDHLTLDTPVIARATLRPGQSWSFATMAGLRRWGMQNTGTPREIVVEWRDKTMKLIASRSAGAPPWTSWNERMLPLRVIAGTETNSELLGGKAYVEHAANLPDTAQWYVGFSAVVIPLGSWLEQPQKVREAIVGSGVFIVLFGFPRPNQPLDPWDRILLPVAFTAQPGSYAAPWPYRTAGTVPLSWRAKDGADKVGADQNPYIARTNAVAWAADEVAFTRPLPAIAVHGNSRPIGFGGIELEAPQRNLLSAYSGRSASVIALLVAIAGWFLLRKTPRLFVTAGVVLIAGVLFAGRDRIRPPSAVRDRIVRLTVAPGIVDRVRITRSYGPAPLAPVIHDSAETRRSITGDYGNWEYAEIRTSQTPPSTGLLYHEHVYDAATRWSYRREIDPSSTSVAIRTVARISQGDAHGPVWFWLEERQQAPWGHLGGQLTPRSDGSAIFTFALPAGAQNGIVEVTTESLFADRDVEIAWETGRIQRKLVKRDVYAEPVAEIPADVCREIAAHGGIAEVTMPGPVEARDRISIHIRRQKS